MGDSTMRLDAVDVRLLELLQQDASRPVKSLAAELGVSSSSVHRRRAALERARVIRRRTVTVDCAKAGRPAVFVIDVALVREDVSSVRSFERRMRAAPEVFECYHASGDRTFLLIVALPANDDLSRFCDWLCADRGEVLRIRTGVVLSQVKYRAVSPLAS